MDAVSLTVNVDPGTARDTATGVLAALKFRLTWTDEWHAIAEKNSRKKAVWLGGFAPHVKVRVRVFAGGDGSTIVRMDPESLGVIGGVAGIVRTQRAYTNLVEKTTAAFTERGALAGVSAG